MKIETIQKQVKFARETSPKNEPSDYKLLRRLESQAFFFAFFMIWIGGQMSNNQTLYRHMSVWMIVLSLTPFVVLGIWGLFMGFRYRESCTWFEKYAPQTVEELKSKISQ